MFVCKDKNKRKRGRVGPYFFKKDRKVSFLLPNLLSNFKTSLNQFQTHFKLLNTSFKPLGTKFKNFFNQFYLYLIETVTNYFNQSPLL